MSMVPVYILERLHPFYVASVEPDLDAAFAEGQRRYIRSLEREMELVKQATRADYDSAFLGRPRTSIAAHSDTGEAQLKLDHRDGDYYEVPCPVCGRACTKQKPALRWDA